MQALYITLIIIGSIIVLISIIFALMYIFNYFYPKRLTYEYAKEWMTNHNGYYDLDKLEKEEYKIKLKSGYELNARLIKSDTPSNKYVIILHGITANQEYDSKYVYAFRKNNYNCITYDSRGHGKNKRTKVTMGIKESKDLLEVIEDSYNRYGKDIFLGIQGESMGGGTCIISLRYKPNIKFAVMDCPFETVKDTTEYVMKNRFHLPKWCGGYANFMATIFMGYNLYKTDVKKDMNNSNIPIALFDGDNDELVPIEALKNIYDAYNSYKELHYYKGSLHARSLLDHEEEYINDLSMFLKKVEGMNNID